MNLEEYKQKYGSEFDKLVEEMNLLHPEEMEEARKWVKDVAERIKAGEAVFGDCKPEGLLFEPKESIWKRWFK